MSKPITPKLVYELTSVASPSLSPDGTKVAFVQSKVDEESMETQSKIMVKFLPDGEVRQFTNGPKDSLPQYSRNGEQLAFLRPDSKDVRQIWVMAVRGGEARQVTSVPGGITEFSWSPDSKKIVFVSDVDPDRQPADSKDKGPRTKVVRRVRYRADTVGWRGDAFRHLFVVDVESSEFKQITHGEGEDSEAVWSPDGSKIAFVSDRRQDRDFVWRDEVYVVSLTVGELQEWSQGLSTVSAVTWSPNGSKLAVIGSDDDEVGAVWQGQIFILEQGKPPKRITDDEIRPAAGYAPTVPAPELLWTDDNRILLIGDSKGESFLCEVPADGGQVKRIVGGNAMMGSASFDSSGKSVALTIAPPSSSGDLHLVNILSGTSTQITKVNEKYFNESPAAGLEKFSIERNGMSVEVRVFQPPDFDPSKKYPLILDIHGGPQGVFSDSFNATQQVLATNGYIVIAVNPRGSSTYGVEFTKAVLGDWGGEDYLDIMAGLDEVCSRPYVDTSRLGITGYSYGGYMSSWIIGHDNRFKAAVVGAPVTNLHSFYGTSDIGIRFGEVQMQASGIDDVDVYLKHSPLTYVKNVDTPVLLLHGEADVRCPIEQSEQYFVALKRLGKEVEFVRFPDCSHLFLRGGHPRMREEYLARSLAWFDNHIGVLAETSAQPEVVHASD